MNDNFPGAPRARRRPRRRSRLGLFFSRHPLIALTLIVLCCGGILIFEIARLAGARHTVRGSWTLGLLAGAAIALVIAGALVALRRAARGRAARVYAMVSMLVGLSCPVLLRATLPPSDQSGPYRITTPAEVGEIAYCCVLLVLVLALMLFAAVRTRTRARARQAASGDAGLPPQTF